MSIADIAKEATEGRLPWRTCAVCHALDTIPPPEAEGLRELLRGRLRYTEISALIAADPDTPLNIDDGTLARHAKGRCAAREKLR